VVKKNVRALIFPVLVVWRLTTIKTKANATVGVSADSFAMKMAGQFILY